MDYRILVTTCASVILMLGSRANAETVIPQQGQTPEQIQADTAACKSQVKSVYDQTLAAAEVRGNQYENYDELSDDAQQEYRQNQAQEAAVAGAVVGGSRQRRDRREQAQSQQQEPQQQSDPAEQSADAASKQAFSACMSGKGYTIAP